MAEPREWVTTEWALWPPPERDAHTPITVSRMWQRDGSALFAVRWRGRCLNDDGEWEWEPIPSSRDAAFMARCRFTSLGETMLRAERAAIETEAYDG